MDVENRHVEVGVIGERAMADTRFEVHRGLGGLDSLRHEWRAMASNAPRTSFVSYPEWYECYLRCLSDEPETALFAVLRRDCRMVAVWPLRPHPERVLGLRCRGLRQPQDSELIPSGDLIVAAGEEIAAAAERCLSELNRLPGRAWDKLVLEFVPESACCAAAASGLRQLQCLRRPRGYRDILHLKPYEEMVKGLSRRTKSHLRTGRNRVERAGGAIYATATAPRELAEAVEVLVEVEAAGWKSKAGTSVKQNPRLVAFYRMLADRFGGYGQCHVHTMVVAGRPVAAEFVLLSGEVAYFIKGGYDESHRDLGPGNRIMSYAMQYYYGQTPIRTFDLMGDFEYMRVWKPVREAETDIGIFNRTPAGRMAAAAMAGSFVFERAFETPVRRLVKRVRNKLSGAAAQPAAETDEQEGGAPCTEAAA